MELNQCVKSLVQKRRYIIRSVVIFIFPVIFLFSGTFNLLLTPLVGIIGVSCSRLESPIDHPIPGEFHSEDLDPIPGESHSEDYKVWVNGKRVFVHIARVQDPPWHPERTRLDFGGNYSFTSFDLDEPVKVIIRSENKLLGKTIFRPDNAEVKNVVRRDHKISFTIDKPIKLSIEPDGKNAPLLLFANPLEENIPDINDNNVIFFGPGVHEPERHFIEIGDNQTLYLAEGAIVKAGVLVSGDNAIIRGRGILCGNVHVWREYVRNLVLVRGNNVVVSGIIVRGAATWSIALRDCNNVEVYNVKVLGGRAQNDDGINPVNAQDILIHDVFIRTDDDCIAIKGMMTEKPYYRNTERITVKNSILWVDRARVVLLGHESRAEYMRDILFENIDILHWRMTAFLIEPGEDMRLENVVFRDIRINGQGQRELIRLKPIINQYMHTKVPGYISDITFENISLTGTEGDYLIELIGYDKEYKVSGVELSNITINGQRIHRNSENLVINEFVDNVSIK